MKRISSILCIAIAAVACSPRINLIPAENFEGNIDGKQVGLYTLTAGNLTMQVTNYGGRVISLWTPDRNGNFADVVIGYDKLDTYVNNPGERYLGAAVGPVANRIGKGTFSIDGQTYQCPLNNNGNTLHGGTLGIDMIVWDVVECTESSILLKAILPDLQDGFPGNRTVLMRYTLTEDDEFKVEYEAVTDKATPMNLSHHSFFNLRGCGNGEIYNHEMQIFASYTTPVDELLIPTGDVVSVEGTPQDFREPHAIGERINVATDQMINAGGYDHNWCVDRGEQTGLSQDAAVYEPEYGRYMEIFSDQSGIQFYSGNFFDGSTTDKYGNPIIYRGSIALETQVWPDAVNQANFPNSVLRPGETYTHTCIYKFSAK